MVLIQGEVITLYLFKGGVSKNLWTYLKVPNLVACEAMVLAPLSVKFYSTLCECVQILFRAIRPTLTHSVAVIPAVCLPTAVFLFLPFIFFPISC